MSYTWRECKDMHTADWKCPLGIHWMYGARHVGFTQVADAHGVTPFWECGECKSVVLKTGINDHMVWHNDLMTAAEQAEYAAGMMRPIG